MYREKIDAYIDAKKDEMLEDLKTLVRIDSTRGEALPGKPFGEGPAAVVKAAGELMEKAGLTVTNYDNYCIAGDLLRQEKALDILAHLDVVPVTEDWTVTQPFEPLVTEGRIYGRGTADNKGPAVAALYAIRAMKDLEIPLRYGIRLILGSDEECGSSDLAYYYTKEKEAKYTFTPDADFPVINLEKARLAKSFEADLNAGCCGEEEKCCENDSKCCQVCLVSLNAGSKVNVVPQKAEAVLCCISKEQLCASWEEYCSKNSRGSLSAEMKDLDGGCVKLVVKGCSAHASTPEIGENALTALLGFLAEILTKEGKTKDVIVHLSQMFPHGDTCGKAIGIAMEDEASGALTMSLGILKVEDGKLYGEYDVRAPLCATDENLTKVLSDAFAKGGIIMESGKMKPAHYVPADSLFVKTLLDSYERYFGKKGEPIAIGGGTYVHDLERGVAFGCGVEGVDNHMHGDDEFMEVDMLVKSAKIFADVIVKLCGEN